MTKITHRTLMVLLLFILIFSPDNLWTVLNRGYDIIGLHSLSVHITIAIAIIIMLFLDKIFRQWN